MQLSRCILTCVVTILIGTSAAILYAYYGTSNSVFNFPSFKPMGSDPNTTNFQARSDNPQRVDSVRTGFADNRNATLAAQTTDFLDDSGLSIAYAGARMSYNSGVTADGFGFYGTYGAQGWDLDVLITSSGTTRDMVYWDTEYGPVFGAVYATPPWFTSGESFQFKERAFESPWWVGNLSHTYDYYGQPRTDVVYIQQEADGMFLCYGRVQSEQIENVY